MSNKTKIIVWAAIFLIIVIATVAFVCKIGGNEQTPTEPTIQINPSQTGDQQLELPPKISTKSWANAAWLNKVGVDEIKEIRFVASGPSEFTQAWHFDNIQFLFANGTVYVEVGSGLKITGSMNGAFANIPNLESISGLGMVDTSQVTDMSNLVKDCSSLKTIDLSNLDTSRVLLAESMFENCYLLQELDLSNLDLRSAIDLDRMFYNCKKMQNLSLPKTRDVISMSYMFYGLASSSEYEAKINGELNTENCEDMSYMFATSPASSYAIWLSQEFNTKNLKNAEGMFANSAVSEINLSNWDTSRLENVSNMFANTAMLMSCNMSGWDMSSLKNCEDMFNGCVSLPQLELGWVNVPNVQNAARMFARCFSMKSLDITCFNDLQFGDTREMFHNCNVLEAIYCTRLASDASTDMFRNCYKINSSYDATKTDVSMANQSGYFSVQE